MADSPWNAKPRPRRRAQAGAQEAVQRPAPLPPPPQAGAPGLNPPPAAHMPLAGRRVGGNPAAPSLWRLPALLLVVLALGVLAGAVAYALENGRINALSVQRAEEARRLQAWREEHLSARAHSGYLETIRKYAREYGIDPSFVSAVIKCESSFNPLAVSRVGARGLMQIMPDTGVWLAEKLGIAEYRPEMLFEPDFNIRMGAYYLAHLSNLFSGSPAMVAAAYHAGDGSVKDWALRLAEDQKTIAVDQIPADDTRSYVRKVLDAYAIYHEEDLGATLGDLPGAVASAGAGRRARAGQ